MNEREYRLKKKYQHKYTANQKASREWWNKCWTEELEKRKQAEAERKERENEWRESAADPIEAEEGEE